MRHDLHLCFGITHGTREGLAAAWFFASLIVGLGLIPLGARAAGVGVLGSVGGAIIGMFNGAANLDLFPGHMSVGATVALLICGLAGSHGGHRNGSHRRVGPRS